MAILEELKELSVFIQRETNLKNVSIVHSPLDAEGERVVVDHGSTEHQEGIPMISNVPVTVTLSDAKENWQKILQAAETIQYELRQNKAHKWLAGDIERVEDESRYVLRLSLTVPIRIA